MEASSESTNRSEDPCIVIAFGRWMTRAGFAGDATPKCVFRSAIGRTRNPVQPVGMNIKPVYVGDEAIRLRGVLMMRQWFDNLGFITNFDDVEKIWHHIFYNEVCVAPESTTVLLTQPPLNPKANSERMATIMFETFGVKSLHIAVDAVLALFRSCRTRGVLVDCGHFRTNIVPIWDGHVLAHAINCGGIGGCQLTDYLIELLTKAGFSCRPGTWNIDNDIKEQLGYVALDYEDELSLASDEWQKAKVTAVPDTIAMQTASAGQAELAIFEISGSLLWQGFVFRSQQIYKFLMEIGSNDASCCQQLVIKGVPAENNFTFGSYLDEDEKADAVLVTRRLITRDFEFPDGNRLPICSQRFQCAEPLMEPRLLGKEQEGIHKSVVQSVGLCDESIRAALFLNIILSGGSACFQGLEERMTKELKLLVPSSCSVQVTTANNPRGSTWIGGSMLASASLFKSLCITKEVYTKVGPEIVHQQPWLQGEDLEALQSQLALGSID